MTNLFDHIAGQKAQAKERLERVATAFGDEPSTALSVIPEAIAVAARWKYVNSVGDIASKVRDGIFTVAAGLEILDSEADNTIAAALQPSGPIEVVATRTASARAWRSWRNVFAEVSRDRFVREFGGVEHEQVTVTVECSDRRRQFRFEGKPDLMGLDAVTTRDGDPKGEIRELLHTLGEYAGRAGNEAGLRDENGWRLAE